MTICFHTVDGAVSVIFSLGRSLSLPNRIRRGECEGASLTGKESDLFDEPSPREEGGKLSETTHLVRGLIQECLKGHGNA